MDDDTVVEFNDFDDVASFDMVGSASSSGPAAESGASILLEVPHHGYIRYYHADGRYEATCLNTFHVHEGSHCRLTRASTRRPGTEPGNGRPLGLFVAWLWLSRDSPDREEHRSPFTILPIPLNVREDARRLIKDALNGLLMSSKERPSEIGEQEEPIDCPMGW